MKSFSFAKALVVSSLLGLVLPVACGDSEENPNPNPSDGGEDGGGGEPSGAGGTAAGGAPAVMLPEGISDVPSTIECGGDCDSARVGLGPVEYHIEPCCESDVCGLNTTFLADAGGAFADTCQPKDQPGEVDANCASPPGAVVPTSDTTTLTLDPLPGCCRPDGTCGVFANEVTTLGGAVQLGDLGLGCVDAAPFFPGEDPVPCGEGAVGGSGAGGASAGGAPPTSAGDGAGGASGGAGGAN